jgi:type IV secretory pathway TrbD component
MAEPFTGFSAPVYRALFLPRTNLGLPREVCAIYWGLWSIPLMCFKPPWQYWLVLVGMALVGHGLLAYAGRNDPYWFIHLKQKWHHPELYTTHTPAMGGHDVYAAQAADDPVLQEAARILTNLEEVIETRWPPRPVR